MIEIRNKILNIEHSGHTVASNYVCGCYKNGNGVFKMKNQNNGNNTYIISHYNPSVRIIDLFSHSNTIGLKKGIKTGIKE